MSGAIDIRHNVSPPISSSRVLATVALPHGRASDTVASRVREVCAALRPAATLAEPGKLQILNQTKDHKLLAAAVKNGKCSLIWSSGDGRDI